VNEEDNGNMEHYARQRQQVLEALRQEQQAAREAAWLMKHNPKEPLVVARKESKSMPRQAWNLLVHRKRGKP
jgi:hypothetical protein